jgi:hypothetical protein
MSPDPSGVLHRGEDPTTLIGIGLWLLQIRRKTRDTTEVPRNASTSA